VNLVRLDDTFQAVDCRTYDMDGQGLINGLFFDYISALPPGTLVLIATKEDVGARLNDVGRRALKLLGADDAVLVREGW
jgi:hypothetical protein